MGVWGVEFADNMPLAILEAIKKARGDVEGSIENEEYRKRLQDKFGSRWTIRRMVAAKPESVQQTTSPATITTDETPVPDLVIPTKLRSKRKRTKSLQHVRLLAKPGTGGTAVELEVPVDVPKYRYGEAEDFEESWHLAQWSPSEPGGPTVVLNKESPMLLEAIKYHQDQYPDVYADDVRKTVMEVYGEVAVAKIAHSQKLVTKVSEQELDQSYRNEAALTVALMGLLAEDMLIGVRLGKLGKKKAVA
jgi:hypothetical protein